MIPLYLDLETFSPVPITHGTYRYAEEAEIIMWQYAIGDGPVIVLDYDEVDLTAMREMLLDEKYEIYIQNSMFDRVILEYVLDLKIPVKRIFDTLVCGLAHSMPGSLEKLCELLWVDDEQSKDKRGKALISLFCIPPGKKNARKYRATKFTHPKEWAEFREYGHKDITALREIARKLPKWNYGVGERHLWEIDQRINDRGICIDVPLVDAAIAATNAEKKSNDARTLQLTEGNVSSANRRNLLILHILEYYGIPVEDLRAATVEKLLENPHIPWEVREILLVRLQSSKSSVTKYKRLKACVNSDGRLRGSSQFCGASRTGRSSGRLFQPLNLPRPTMEQEDIEDGIRLLKSGAWEFLGDRSATDLASNALRATIVAPPGKKLVIADLSNIEGRVLAWLTFEEWKLEAFMNYDSGLTGDPYITGYAKSFGVPVSSVTKDMRQIEKVKELAFQYGGGLGAWVTFATAYRIDLAKMAEKIIGELPSNIVKEALQFIQWSKDSKKSLYGLDEQTVVVCDGLKRQWRSNNARIASYWKELEDACKQAILTPGELYRVRRHAIRVDGSWLRISLPGGNYLQYLHPQVIDDKLTYMGQNQFTRKWERLGTYGGKLAENIAQKVARNVLWYAMPEVESAGYEIDLHVYDEIVAEVPDSQEFGQEGLSKLMTAENEWNKGLPLAAKGFEAYLYQKG